MKVKIVLAGKGFQLHPWAADMLKDIKTVWPKANGQDMSFEEGQEIQKPDVDKLIAGLTKAGYKIKKAKSNGFDHFTIPVKGERGARGAYVSCDDGDWSVNFFDEAYQ